MKVKAELNLAGMLVVEAVPKLELLRQAIHVFCRMRMILWLEGNREEESGQNHGRRLEFY